ncbi:MAG: ABC transporter substrate-binding protein [Treponema sp.]|jgi:NitT/TauT family transport system substrate-binding protein|nr:ABC transporter substrate-binding protein [Treponema sp.]
MKFMKLCTGMFCFCTVVLSVQAGSMREQSQRIPLSVGIMPDADSLPFMVARDEGLFTTEGVDVNLILFSNPQERDAALQAGNLDGSISDLLAAAFFAAGGFDFKVTSVTDGRYGIIVAPHSGINQLSELRGKQIALSRNTIIQYTVDALLQSAGVSFNEYEAVSVPRMPLRLEMVLNGQVSAASLPEPLLTAASAAGAALLATTDTTGIDAGILLFSQKTLDTRLSDVQKFYRAYYKAAQKINADPHAYRDYLVEKAGFPQEVRNAYQFVYYREPQLPAIDQIEQALKWLENYALLSHSLNPSDLIDGRAIAEWYY